MGHAPPGRRSRYLSKRTPRGGSPKPPRRECCCWRCGCCFASCCVVENEPVCCVGSGRAACCFLLKLARIFFPGLFRFRFAGPGGGTSCSAAGFAGADADSSGGFTGGASRTVVAEASPPTSIDSAGSSTGDEIIFDFLGIGTGFCFGVDDPLLCASKQGTILMNFGLWPKASNASRVPGPRSADTATLQRTFSEKVLTTS